MLNFTWAYQGLIKIKQFEKDDQICRNSINTTLIQNIIKQQLLRCSVILAYRYLDQGNKLKSPEIDPYIYGQFIFDKNTKVI